MSRIQARFEALKQSGRKALVSFITAGDPRSEVTVPLMHSMVRAGVDILELGVPFSDPMADGPVIQRATERALEHHVSLHDVFDMVEEFRRQDALTPVVLMGYLNPIEVMGYEAVADRAVQAGVDGLLTVDLPPEEGQDWTALLQARDLDPIFLLSPTTTDERVELICGQASGFIYYVSLKGVTGSRRLDVSEVEAKLAAIRGHTDLPVGVGFGISDAEAAAQVAGVSDAVVVGSALVRMVEENPSDQAAIENGICALLADMRSAMDSI